MTDNARPEEDQPSEVKATADARRRKLIKAALISGPIVVSVTGRRASASHWGGTSSGYGYSSSY